MGIFKSFHPYAATTIFFWSCAYVFTRLALQHFSPLPLGFLRYLVACAALLAAALITRMKLPDKKDIPNFLACGMAGFFLYMVAFNIGTSYVTAATSSLIIASVPVLTALLAAAFFREKLKGYQWIAIAVEFAGIVFLTVYESVFSLNSGTWWLLLAAVMLSAYNLLQRRLIKKYSAMQATTWSILAGTALLAVFAPAAVDEVMAAPPLQIGYVLFLGIFCSAVAYASWAKALEIAEKTSMVSNYMFFTPFVTGILGFALAGEVPGASTWAGGACIIAGALLFHKESLQRK